jgi:hypothetical protein
MAGRSPREIPHFLRSKTPEGLKREMGKLNSLTGYQNKYFDIQFVNGEWFCWYYFEPSTAKEFLKPTDEVAVTKL